MKFMSVLQGTSRIIRSLVGPEDGEDDDEDYITLSDGSNETNETEDESNLSVSAVGSGTWGGFGSNRQAKAGNRAVADGAQSGGSKDKARTEKMTAARTREEDGRATKKRRQRSLLGLTKASSDEADGLGPWKVSVTYTWSNGQVLH